MYTVFLIRNEHAQKKKCMYISNGHRIRKIIGKGEPKRRHSELCLPDYQEHI